VLLMMTITGAVYPAIDVTAGERERGTLEALVAAPVSRHELLLAKYVAVLTVALLTAVVNLVAMFTTISAAGLGSIVFGHAGLSLWLGVQLGGLLLLFASFFSAVLLAITSFARSFREAQAYLIPLMLLTLGPGLLSLSPALELTGPMALLPLMNVVLLARDLFLGTVSAPTALVVVVTTLVYAALAIGLASRIFGSDAILPGSTMSWRAARTSGTPRTENLGAAAMVLSIAMAGALQSTLGPLLLRWGSAGGTAGEIGAGALGTLGIFLGIPIVAGSMTGTSLRRICRLNWADLRSWLSATLLGLGSGVLVIEVTLRGQSSGWLEVSEALREALQMKSAALEALPLACVLFCLALIPALAEECFFRGLVQSGCQRLLGGTAGMFLTALTFAIFHVVSPGVLLWERFFPSFTLGLLLGALAWSARSTWPGVWLHAINNAGLLLLARYKAELVGAGWLDGEAVRLPWLWLAGAAATTITGVVLLKKSRQHPSPVSSTP
jgi:ABC-2 type transport system permease protein/sodium transport system permease protein